MKFLSMSSQIHNSIDSYKLLIAYILLNVCKVSRVNTIILRRLCVLQFSRACLCSLVKIITKTSAATSSWRDEYTYLTYTKEKKNISQIVFILAFSERLSVYVCQLRHICFVCFCLWIINTLKLGKHIVQTVIKTKSRLSCSKAHSIPKFEMNTFVYLNGTWTSSLVTVGCVRQ